MGNKSSYLKVFFLCGILLTVMFTGCIEKNQKLENVEESSMPEIQMDQPSILPDWKDGEYHDYPATKQMLNGFDMDYPDLVNVFSIGKT